MALTNIFAVLTYLVSFTFLKTEKGHDLLVTEDNHHYRKEREKDTKFGRRKYRVCAYGDKYGFVPVLLLLRTMSLSIGT